MAYEVYCADIDAEFERGRGYQHFHLAFFQLSFGFEAQLAGQASVMGGDVFFAEAFAQLMSDALRHAARVHEHESRAMRIDELDNALVNLSPHLVRRYGAEFGVGDFDGQIHLPLVAYVDDHGIRASLLFIGVTRQETRYLLDRLLGGGQADARGRALGQRFQAFEREREMDSTLVIGDGMDFVDDHGFDVAQDGAAFLGGEENIKRLGRRHQDVRWTLEHEAAIFGERVAGADGGANLRHQEAALTGHLEDFPERDLEVLLDVVAERLEGGDVEDFSTVG